ncbi:MAG TPA: alpha/beta hydrolase, partial [Balneolaceae bacterium]|nr:alpha/beta hydrolase [Balneolaceae bacterium]
MLSKDSLSRTKCRKMPILLNYKRKYLIHFLYITFQLMMKTIFILCIVVLMASCQNNKGRNKEQQTQGATNPVAEKTYVNLGGDPQYVEMTGASDQLPVLLFLHGGPGWPQTASLRYFNSDLTKDMIVVSWDQAGCGKSYIKDPNPKNLSVASLENDAHELTQYLKNKYHKNKIFLVGFSYGSVIGLKLVKQYPEDYYAYIGVSQLINFQQSWDASMQWLQAQAEKNNDKTTLHQLQLIQKGDPSVCKTTLQCFLNKYQLLEKYRGAVYDKAKEKEIEKAEGYYEDYKDYDY